MARREDRLARVRANPKGVHFSDRCALASSDGWVLDRQSGSHRIFKRTGHRQLMNFQDDGGKAMPYQVRQLIRAIDELRSEDA